MFSRFISRKTFLAAGVAGVVGAWRGPVQAAPLPADGSWPWVREWVSGGRVGGRLWVHVDCPSGADYAWAICPALYACGLELPLNVSAIGEPLRNNVLPVRFLMTARFAGGHTLVLNVSPSVPARTTIRGEYGGIDIGGGRMRVEEFGRDTPARTEPRPPLSTRLCHLFECSDLDETGDRYFAKGAAIVRLGTWALAQGAG